MTVSAGSPAPVDEVLDLFDRLPTVSEVELVGEWNGAVVPTGHPGEQQLGALRWVGKTFRSRDDVDPIVCHNDTGAREANPVLGAASIRMVEYRGVVTATMVYDRHPIFDHFRGGDRSAPRAHGPQGRTGAAGVPARTGMRARAAVLRGAGGSARSSPRWSSTRYGATRCWSRSPASGSATPTWSHGTGSSRSRCRPCSATRAPAA